MEDNWWEDDKTGESSQDEPTAVPGDGEKLVLKANRQVSGVLPIAFISFFLSGFIINPISELGFFPEPYVFYIVSVFATALLFMVGLSFIWTIFDKHWWTIIIDGDNVVLKRYLPLKINSFSYKQLKSTDIEMVVMERVWVEHNDSDD
jgi:putative Mn2+ efflux pump MntP